MPLAAIVAVGVALRLYLIADKSLWLDEAFSVWMGRQQLGAMWRYLVQLDQHPPLYYTLLHVWMRLGEREELVRGFSALWGILTLPVIYYVGDAEPDQRGEALRLIMQRDAAALRLRLIESGAVRRTSESAQRLVMAAKGELGHVQAGPARNLLAALADAVVSRNS